MYQPQPLATASEQEVNKKRGTEYACAFVRVVFVIECGCEERVERHARSDHLVLHIRRGGEGAFGGHLTSRLLASNTFLSYNDIPDFFHFCFGFI